MFTSMSPADFFSRWCNSAQQLFPSWRIISIELTASTARNRQLSWEACELRSGEQVCGERMTTTTKTNA
jgi:hypothetical protein